MYCKNCGKSIADDVTFCPQCGTSVQNQIPSMAVMESSAYVNVLKSQSEQETKIDRIVSAIEIVVCIAVFLYYMGIGNDVISSAIASVLLCALVCSITVSPIVKKYKKTQNIYKAADKYAKYQELVSSMSSETAIQTVEIEYHKIVNEHSHGVLYFLLCVLTIIVIISLC